jgi:hypothetical protein
MKMAVFWDVTPCRLVDIDRHFRGTYCHNHQGVTLIAVKRRSSRPHGATSQKTAISIVVAVRTSNLTYLYVNNL